MAFRGQRFFRLFPGALSRRLHHVHRRVCRSDDRGNFYPGIGWFLGAFAWAVLYNKHYTTKLMERGYTLADGPGPNALAAAALGIPYLP